MKIRIRKLLLLLFIVSCAKVGTLFAQAPLVFTYQTVLRDDAGQVLQNQDVAVQLTILRGSPEGTMMFSETHNTTTNEFGLVSLRAGSINSMEIIDWSANDYFLRVTVDGTVMGTNQLLSVPYALHSLTSSDSFSGDFHDLENVPDFDGFVSMHTTAAGSMVYFGGENWLPVLPGEEGNVLRVVDGRPQWTELDYIPPTVTDIDGNVYGTVTIGGQVWMSENLRTTRYANGDRIPTGLVNNEWENTTEGAYGVYPHDNVPGISSDEEMAEAYGYLYNGYTVLDDRGICPEGWRVPSDEDFTELSDYLIENYGHITEDNVGDMLKSCRQVGSPLGGDCDTNEHPLWIPDDTHYGRDEFGLGIVAPGARWSYGGYAFIHDTGNLWSSTPLWADGTYGRATKFSHGFLTRLAWANTIGFPVRCIRE